MEEDKVYTVQSRGYEVYACRVRKVAQLVLSSITIPSCSSNKIAKVLIRTISSLSRVCKALLVNTIERLLDELSRNLFFVDKTLQFTFHIILYVFNVIKKAFDDEHIAFKVIKSVSTVLLPDFIDIVVQRKSDISYSYST